MSILVVDDSRTQLFLIASLLSNGGYRDILTAHSAQEAFAYLRLDAPKPDSDIDLILMDLDMPEIGGLEACQRIKTVEELKDIPIIVITASSGPEVLQAAFDAGAMDYLAKPPNEVEMLARVRSALRLKNEIDQRKAREKSLVRLSQNLAEILDKLQVEQDKSERLLLNILPLPIALRLKAGEQVIADYIPEASVLFTDVMDFTAFAARVAPAEVVEQLNRLFKRIDILVKRFGLEKIKTSGDAYMVAGGVPMPRSDHLEALADLAVELQDELAQDTQAVLQVKTGIQVGPVIAGVIGEDRFIYDIWGDTVNVASRMQANAPAGQTLVTQDVYRRLKDRFTFDALGNIPVKGKGEMDVYVLKGRK